MKTHKKLLLATLTSALSAIALLELTAAPYLELKTYLARTYLTQKLKLQGSILTYTGHSPSSLYSDTDLRQLARLQAEEAGLNPFLVESLITQESNWKVDAVSSRGALGLMQIMPQWKNHALCPSYQSNTSMFNPISNLKCGISILAHEIRNQGSTHRGLQVFNGGIQCLKNKKCFDATATYASNIVAEAHKKLSL